MRAGPDAYVAARADGDRRRLAAALAFACCGSSRPRARRGAARRGGGETALLSAALEEAVAKLKAQERATAARADASERLSGEIIASLTAGLLVVGLDGEVRILNPAGRRHAARAGRAAASATTGRLLGEPALVAVIDECLADRARRSCGGRSNCRRPIARTTHLGVTVSPLFDEHGELHGAICLFTDLTASSSSRSSCG